MRRLCTAYMHMLQDALTWQYSYQACLSLRALGRTADALAACDAALKTAYFDDLLHLKHALEKELLVPQSRSGAVQARAPPESDPLPAGEASCAARRPVM